MTAPGGDVPFYFVCLRKHNSSDFNTPSKNLGPTAKHGNSTDDGTPSRPTHVEEPLSSGKRAQLFAKMPKLLQKVSGMFTIVDVPLESLEIEHTLTSSGTFGKEPAADEEATSLNPVELKLAKVDKIITEIDDLMSKVQESFMINGATTPIPRFVAQSLAALYGKYYKEDLDNVKFDPSPGNFAYIHDQNDKDYMAGIRLKPQHMVEDPSSDFWKAHWMGVQAIIKEMKAADANVLPARTTLAYGLVGLIAAHETVVTLWDLVDYELGNTKMSAEPLDNGALEGPIASSPAQMTTFGEELDSPKSVDLIEARRTGKPFRLLGINGSTRTLASLPADLPTPPPSATRLEPTHPLQEQCQKLVHLRNCFKNMMDNVAKVMDLGCATTARWKLVDAKLLTPYCMRDIDEVRCGCFSKVRCTHKDVDWSQF